MAKSLLLFTDIGNIALVANFKVLNMSFNPIRKNKILANISEFAVYTVICYLLSAVYLKSIIANSMNQS